MSRSLWLLLANLAWAGTASAGTVALGPGATVDLGSGSLDLGCADLAVGGTLSAGSVGFGGAGHVIIDPGATVNGGSATLEVGGDWNNAGVFNPGTSTVRFVDDCHPGSAVITGDTTFGNLDITTLAAKEYQLAAASSQTVSQSLSLQGAPGNLLRLRSTVGGGTAFLDVQGPASGDYVDVEDIDATPGNPIALGGNSVLGFNTPGWISSVPVPALGGLGLVALVLSLLWGRRLALATRRNATGALSPSS